MNKMKNKIVFGLVLIGFTVMYGCGESAVTNPLPEPVVPAFSCNVDGVLWTADPNQTFIFSEDTLEGVDFVFSNNSRGTADFDMDIAALSVVDGDTTLIQGEILFGTGSIVGTFPLTFTNEGENSMIFVKKSGGQSLLESFFTSYVGYLGDADQSISPGTQVGTFTVSAYDETTKKMSGTFSFTQQSSADVDPALPSNTITQGTFTDIIVGE